MKIIETFIKPWFFSNDDERIKAPYVIAFVMLHVTVITAICQISMVLKCYNTHIDALWNLTPLVGIEMASVGGYIALYTWGVSKSTNRKRARKKEHLTFTERFLKPFLFSQEDPDHIRVTYLFCLLLTLLTIGAIIAELVMVMECFHKRIEAKWSLTSLIAVLLVAAEGSIALYNWGIPASSLPNLAMHAGAMLTRGGAAAGGGSQDSEDFSRYDEEAEVVEAPVKTKKGKRQTT